MIHEDKPSLEELRHDTILIGKQATVDILSHYGVKGMKWGVRKKDDRAGLDPVTAMLAVYGAVAVGMIARGVYNDRKDSGAKEAKKRADIPWKKDPKLAEKNLSVETLHTRVVGPINSKPPFGEPGTMMNCRRCTFAYEMRRRGNDVKATTSHYGSGQAAIGVDRATNNTTNRKKQESLWGEQNIPVRLRGNDDDMAVSTSIFSALNKQPDGARGEVGVGWMMGGGHSMAFEKVQGKAVIFDAQSGKVYRNPNDFMEFAPVVTAAALTRLDNKPINDQFIRRWAQNVE